MHTITLPQRFQVLEPADEVTEDRFSRYQAIETLTPGEILEDIPFHGYVDAQNEMEKTGLYCVAATGNAFMYYDASTGRVFTIHNLDPGCEDHEEVV